MNELLSRDDVSTLMLCLTGGSPWTASFWGEDCPDVADIDWRFRILLPIDLPTMSPQGRQIAKIVRKCLDHTDQHNPGDMAKIERLQARVKDLEQQIERSSSHEAAYKAAASLENQTLRQESIRGHFNANTLLEWLVDKVMQHNKIHCSAFMRDYLMHFAGHQCMWLESALRCDKRTKLEIDHCVPREHGGSYTYDNTGVLCQRHNNLKSSRLEPDVQYWKRPEYSRFRDACRLGERTERREIEKHLWQKLDEEYARAHNGFVPPPTMSPPRRAFGPG